MSRLFIDDVSRRDPRALITTAKLAGITDITASVPQYVVPTGDATITVIAGCVVTVTGGGFFIVDNNAPLSALNLDVGSSFTPGKDYYIYICDTGNIADIERFVISLNSTFPTGWNANNSRKIGGFHYGKCRRVNAALAPVNSANEARGDGWEANIYDGIVPRSVWTLKHRPKCQPEGMVFLGGGTWVDIYLSSDDGNGGAASVFNATPLTGTEGLNWYRFVERMLASGKRLLSYDEFCQAAAGSPGGLAGDNTNAWTGGSARQLTGYVARAVSSIGCRDCVGNVWEWLRDLVTNASGRVLSGTTNPTSYTYTDGDRNGQVVTNGTGHGPTTRTDGSANSAQGAYGWDRVSPFGDGYGNIYEYYDQSLIALYAGGRWSDGVGAGARAVGMNHYPWHVYTSFGARGACDSL